ncbi:hypothetical protein AK812_SmicGene47338, partial [Symbiodinium microadriaticum]
MSTITGVLGMLAVAWAKGMRTLFASARLSDVEEKGE